MIKEANITCKCGIKHKIWQEGNDWHIESTPKPEDKCCEHEWNSFTREKDICVICMEKRVKQEVKQEGWEERFDELDFSNYCYDCGADKEVIKQFIS